MDIHYANILIYASFIISIHHTHYIEKNSSILFSKIKIVNFK